jgi:protein Mpv17
VFLSTRAYLDGKTAMEIKEHLSETYRPAVLMNYQIWPLVQLFNFAIVPLK